MSRSTSTHGNSAPRLDLKREKATQIKYAHHIARHASDAVKEPRLCSMAVIITCTAVHRKAVASSIDIDIDETLLSPIEIG